MPTKVRDFIKNMPKEDYMRLSSEELSFLTSEAEKEEAVEIESKKIPSTNVPLVPQTQWGSPWPKSGMQPLPMTKEQRMHGAALYGTTGAMAGGGLGGAIGAGLGYLMPPESAGEVAGAFLGGGMGRWANILSKTPAFANKGALIRGPLAALFGITEHEITEGTRRAIDEPERKDILPNPFSPMGAAAALLPYSIESFIRQPAASMPQVKTQKALEKYLPGIKNIEDITEVPILQKVEPIRKDITERHSEISNAILSIEDRISLLKDHISRTEVELIKASQRDKSKYFKELNDWKLAKQQLEGQLDNFKIDKVKIEQNILKQQGAKSSANKSLAVKLQQEENDAREIDTDKLEIRKKIITIRHKKKDIDSRVKQKSLYPEEAAALKSTLNEEEKEASIQLADYTIEQKRKKLEALAYDENNRAINATDSNIRRSRIASLEKQIQQTELGQKMSTLRDARPTNPKIEADKLTLSLAEQKYRQQQLQRELDLFQGEIKKRVAINPHLQRLSEKTSASDFLDFVFTDADPKHIEEIRNFYNFKEQPEKFEQIRRAILEKFFLKSYNRQTKTISGARDLFSSSPTKPTAMFSIEKLGELFGGGTEGPKQAGEFKKIVEAIIDSSIEVSNPTGAAKNIALHALYNAGRALPYIYIFRNETLSSGTLGLLGVAGFALGYPFLVESLMKSPNLRNSFIRWAEDGATATALASYPILQNFIAKHGTPIKDEEDEGLGKKLINIVHGLDFSTQTETKKEKPAVPQDILDLFEASRQNRPQ